MSETALLKDLEHRRDLAQELGRYADGREGLGLGTALAGLLALLNLLFLAAFGKAIEAISSLNAAGEKGQMGAWSEVLGDRFLRIYLVTFTILILIPAGWVFLKEIIQARLYRNLGDARSLWPHWENRLTIGLLVVLALVGVIYATFIFNALNAPGEPREALRLATYFVAVLVTLGVGFLLFLAWHCVRGWRNWMGWWSVCSTFFFVAPLPLAATSPLTDNEVFRYLIFFLFAIPSLYLPFLALFMGLRDHLRFLRLVKELKGLDALDEKS